MPAAAIPPLPAAAAAGSAYYHLNPTTATLAWDRLGMCCTFASLLAAVIDRQVELRTLTALGLTRWQISAVIVTEGALIGLAGAIVGVIAGIVMSSIIVHHSVPMVNGWRFTWVIPMRTAVVLALTVFALSAVAGLPPARVGVRRRSAPEERWE